MFVPGKWKVCCDRCGSEFLSDQLRQEWNGLRVCHGPGTNGCWEPRHPQDMLRGRKDDQAPRWARPEPPVVETGALYWNDNRVWVDVQDWLE